MKGSINQGAMKDASASLVKALSGAPKCALVGDIVITYDCDIKYGAGNEDRFHLGIEPPFGTGHPNPPIAYPSGKWLLTVTATVNLPVPYSFRLGMAQQIHGYNPFDLRGRFLVTNGSWDKVTLILEEGGGETLKETATADVDWVTEATSQFGVVIGPDLYSVADISLDKPGVQVTKNILPEQDEDCIYQFFPYLFAIIPFGSFPILLPGWHPGAGINQFGGWQINVPTPGRLYPDGTIIGKIRWEFIRISNMPLFNYTVTPPTTFIFHNRSLCNPALPVTYDWDFGDGTQTTTHSDSTGAGPSPTHTYPAGIAKKYDVVLRATDPAGTKQFDQLIDLRLRALFTFSGRNVVRGGLPVNEVTFVNQSVGGIATYDWDFGDGSAHDTTANPVHSYPRGSSFTVKLTIADLLANTSSVSHVVVT